ncbi:MAG: hypothetical protein WBO16_18845 [Gammaproteobacteria bacterium]|jgi:hypothetical protein
MLGTIFIDQSSKTRIVCAICDLKFEQGMLTPQLAVLDTRYSTVFAEGKVDLKQQQMKLPTKALKLIPTNPQAMT